MSVSTRSLLITGLVSVIVVAATMIGLSLVPPATWDGMRPATCLPDACFCEAVLTSESIRQPLNALSSLAYAVVGVWIVVTAGQASSAAIFGGGHRLMMAISAIVIGVGSAFFHGSMTFVGQFFDILGMYLFTALLLIYALQRLYRWTFMTAAIMYVVFNVILTVVQIGVPDTRRFVFGIVLVLALLAEAVVWYTLKPTRDYAWFWAGMVAFAVAFGVWIADITGAVCDPNSLFQGHALWHGLGAFAVFCVWRWHTSEAV